MQAVAGSLCQQPAAGIRKPLCDKRNYQHAVLENGLRVIVIQDQDATFAAACANVQVGRRGGIGKHLELQMSL